MSSLGRRRLVSGLAMALATRPRRLGAQPGRIPRVGILGAGSAGEPASLQREPFERGLRELGWVPGSTITLEYRYAEGSAERLGELAAELVRLKVDVIVARSRVAIEAARRASPSVAIVMSSTADPVGEGLVKSLARPGGNITGIANLVQELEGKRLELLRDAIPGLTRRRRQRPRLNPAEGRRRCGAPRTPPATIPPPQAAFPASGAKDCRGGAYPTRPSG